MRLLHVPLTGSHFQVSDSRPLAELKPPCSTNRSLATSYTMRDPNRAGGDGESVSCDHVLATVSHCQVSPSTVPASSFPPNRRMRSRSGS